MKMLDAIRKRHAKVAKVMNNFTATPDQVLYYDDVEYLINLLTPQSPGEPPDTPRRVLVAQYGLWHIGQYKHTTPPHKRKMWHVAGVSTHEMLEWRELPPASEEPK